MAALYQEVILWNQKKIVSRYLINKSTKSRSEIY